MVLGDFGTPQEGGFNSAYAKVVDSPKHFRAKPKQAPRLTMWQQTEQDTRVPEYDRTARYGCRARDHTDILTHTAHNAEGSQRLAKRVADRPPTATIVNSHPVGGHAGVRDPNDSGMLHDQEMEYLSSSPTPTRKQPKRSAESAPRKRAETGLDLEMTNLIIVDSPDGRRHSNYFLPGNKSAFFPRGWFRRRASARGRKQPEGLKLARKNVFPEGEALPTG
ncbi:hypothetical protein DIPPA_20065 [Diplonema papillatum]|nr:hypothetical protein DIPPA_20065 [Diplonema papillatum]